MSQIWHQLTEIPRCSPRICGMLAASCALALPLAIVAAPSSDARDVYREEGTRTFWSSFWSLIETLEDLLETPNASKDDLDPFSELGNLLYAESLSDRFFLNGLRPGLTPADRAAGLDAIQSIRERMEGVPEMFTDPRWHAFPDTLDALEWELINTASPR